MVDRLSGFERFCEGLVAALQGRARAAVLPPSPVLIEDLVRAPELLVGELGHFLGLDGATVWGIACSLGPVFDVRLAPLFGQVAGRPRPCGLTREVLGALTGAALDEVDRRFSALLLSSGLPARLGLVEHEGGEVRPSAALRARLAGRSELPHLFAPWMRRQRHVRGRGPALVLDDGPAQAFGWALEAWAQCAHEAQPAPLTYLVGSSGAGRALAAQALAHTWGQSLLVVRWELVPPSLDWLVIVREARWLGAAVLLRAGEDGPPAGWQAQVQSLLDQDLNLIIALTRMHQGGDAPDRAVAWVELPKPSHTARMRLWHMYLPERQRALGLTDDALAFRFRGTGRDIAQLARQALDDAALRGESPPQVSLDALCACAQRRSLSNLRRLGGLERPLAGGVDAVILPQAHQRLLWEVVARVRDRDRVLDAWGFGTKLQTGLGIVVLMSGPPGTGKTLSARAVASELKVPLYRVELSQVVSKWVGETEKHLSGVFDDAEASGVALLFDEADALFAKRTEVRSSNDRHANLEVGYLLQRVEAFSGLCFLTTNITSSLDSAFLRRMAVHLRYELPGEQERALIWRHVLPPQAPIAADVDPDVLAKQFDEMSGGEIRNAALRAAYIAAGKQTQISQDLLAWCAGQERASAGALVRDTGKGDALFG